ncbi:hypothetical protein CPC08DRAFT_766126 [Agrocybe pediades]|nr:hypothetical protein CPC08DRAFT_766126 [Agrocybe pediades]
MPKDPWICLGCSRSFPDRKSLATHKFHCRDYKTCHLWKPAEPLNEAAGSSLEVPGEAVYGDISVDPDHDETMFSENIPIKVPQQCRPRIPVPGMLHDDFPPPAPDLGSLEPILATTHVPQTSFMGSESAEQSSAVVFRTKSNSFSVYQVYRSSLSFFILDESPLDKTLPPAVKVLKCQAPKGKVAPQVDLSDFPSPFANKSIELLVSWFYDTSKIKSFGTLNSLVHDVILDPQFWIQETISIRLPPPNQGSWGKEDDAPVFNVPNLFYCRQLEVIKVALLEDAAKQFSTTPFKEYWKPSEDSALERIYSEIYNSDAFLEEHAKIRDSPRNGCSLEPIIIPILLWSDSTHLASFGNMSLWLIYLFLGNQSKYEHGKPSAFAAHHLAYIPKAIWEKLLDDDLVDAYINRIVLEFLDGISWRIFVRFFIYAADYLEKVLLACIKYLSKHPCPRCTTEKSDIAALGTKLDMRQREQLHREDDKHRREIIELARKLVYTHGHSPGSTSDSMLNLLDPKSLVPTRCILKSSGITRLQFL